MNRRTWRLLPVLALMSAAILTSAPLRADVALPALFADHMLLQRDMAVPVWGTAAVGEKVAVQFADQTKQATADAKGKWRVTLDPLKTNNQPAELHVKGANEVVVRDVLVGEVWVCSGQSNMGMALASANNHVAEIAAANYPDLRIFSVKLAPSRTAATDVTGQWERCSPECMANFSATAYFFGRELHKELKIPIGLVHSSVAGTIIEAWTSPENMAANPGLYKPILDQAARDDAAYPAANERYLKHLAEWQAEADAAKAAGQPIPKNKFSEPPGPLSRNHPSNLYNGMIAPLIPLAMRGVIWYQGEYNCGNAYQYRTLFPAMIADWRSQWGQGNFPFLYVQLANVDQAATQPAADNGWSELREAQAMALTVPNTAMAVAIDTGDATAEHLHPPNKQDVGHRLALAAEGMVYNLKVDYQGPLYSSMKVDGTKVILRFRNAAGGLRTPAGEAVKGFAIAGADRVFVWAEARIEGNMVIVSSDKVAAPVAVRYAWALNPPNNLRNASNLPASPFRTDDWPGVTEKKTKP